MKNSRLERARPSLHSMHLRSLALLFACLARVVRLSRYPFHSIPVPFCLLCASLVLPHTAACSRAHTYTCTGRRGGHKGSADGTTSAAYLMPPRTRARANHVVSRTRRMFVGSRSQFAAVRSTGKAEK